MKTKISAPRRDLAAKASVTEHAALLTGAGITILFVVLFIGPWWNRYLAVTNDGWHFFFAAQILNGKVPYRDYYFFAPPLHLLRIAFEAALFGRNLIVPQFVGLLERVVLAVVLYLWLARTFRPAPALAGTIFTLLFYLQDASETLSSLHHESVFFAIPAGYLACLAMRRAGTRPGYSFMAGTFAGLAFLAKQTSGIAVSGIVALGLVLHALQFGLPHARRTLARVVLGWSLPVAATCAWLAWNGALPQFFSQVYIHGASSKGGLLSSLLRPWLMVADDVYLRRFALISCCVLLFLLVLRRFRTQPDAVGNRWWLLGATGVVSIGGWAMGLLVWRFGGLRLHPFFNEMPASVAILSGVLVCGAVFARDSLRLVRGEFRACNWDRWFMSGFGFWVAYSLGLSWVVYPTMAVPATGVMMAFLMATCAATPASKWLNAAILGSLFVCGAHATSSKLHTPFYWSGWREPDVATATVRSHLPELKGYWISPETAHFVETVTNKIQQYSSPRDQVFVYPHMPLFYFLSGRTPPTFAYVHFTDVCPDDIARADARRLLQTPPAVIVSMEPSEEEMRESERLFRGGQPSGQRDLAAAIQSLTRDYSLVSELTTPLTGKVVRIWSCPSRSALVRPDDQVGGAVHIAKHHQPF